LFHGAYIQASYFLTGESRQFDRKTGAFGRAQVYENFFRVRNSDCGICSGRGAWEIACRWNYLDLTDEDLVGGYLDTSGLGLNWYLSPYMRMMFNYNLADLHDPVDGRSDAQVFSTRLDVHF
jgi:phosphate-selective porin OprO/OprP